MTKKVEQKSGIKKNQTKKMIKFDRVLYMRQKYKKQKMKKINK